MRTIFGEGPLVGYRLLFFVGLSLGLMFIGQRSEFQDSIREGILTAIAPVQWLVSTPGRIWTWSDDSLAGIKALQHENQALREQLLLQESKLQRMADVIAENQQLRELLNGIAPRNEMIALAEITGVNPDPRKLEIIVNRGSSHGVYVGQAVIDDQGLMGQVIRVSDDRCRVMLIADHNHAVPVQSLKTGERGILEGSGRLSRVELVDTPNTTTFESGDLLVTSGLGGRFPKGYPVAYVTTVIRDTGQPFAQIFARPAASLAKGTQVLLVYKGQFRDPPAERPLESGKLAGI